MTEQANNIARDLLPGFLHFISDKKWDDQLDEILYSDLLVHISTECDVPEQELEKLSHAVLDRLQNFTKVLCPQVFS